MTIQSSSQLHHNVIVCIHNGLDDVRHCLQSLEKYWESEGLSSLLLIDDYSDEETATYVQSFANRFAPARYIRLDEQHFYTKAANTGLGLSDATLHTLLNSDTIVTPGWATHIRNIFQRDNNVGIVGPLSNAASTQSLPMVKSSDGQTAINHLPDGVSVEEFSTICQTFTHDLETPYVPIVHGFCYTVHQKVIDKIGLLDEESFPTGYGEENDYSFRCEDAGFALAIALDSFVFHAKSKSYKPAQQQKFSKIGQETLVEKYSARRIKNTIAAMEQQPKLEILRQRVIDHWPSHQWLEASQN